MGNMQIDLYKQLVNTATDSYKALNDTTKTQMKLITNSLAPFVGMELNQENTVPALTKWDNGLYHTRQNNAWIPSGGVLVSLCPLYDGTWLAVFSNVPAMHLTSEFEIISTLPFGYSAPASSGPTMKNYVSPNHASAVNYSSIVSNVDVSRTMIFMSLPSDNVVQVYSYSKNIWTYISSIGTAGTAGNGSSTDLTAPIVTKAVWVPTGVGSNTKIFKIFIANVGTNAAGTSGFIKFLTMDVGGTLKQGYEEISWPTQYHSGLGNGSLLFSETSVATAMGLSAEADQLYLINNATVMEIGSMYIGNSLLSIPNQTKVFKTSFPTLDYSDKMDSPTSLLVLDSGDIVVGDNFGHVVVFNSSQSAVLDSVGKPLSFSAMGVNTKYPFEMQQIVDLQIDPLSGDLVIAGVGGEVFKTNLLRLGDQQIVFATRPIPFSGRLEKIVGLNTGKVEVSLDAGTTWQDISFYELTTISIGTSVYVKVSRTREELKKEYQFFNTTPSLGAIKEGYIVFSI
jgi:hypothetical protein